MIYESICELQDEIYSDDSWLRLVKLEKIDAIIDQSLNIVWNMVCHEWDKEWSKYHSWKDA